MNAEQRARYRRLAEAELERGNALAAILLDALDEMDALGVLKIGHDDSVTGQPPEPTPDQAAAWEGVRHLYERELAVLLPDDPPPAPAAAPTVVPAHDLDFGPGGEIETNLGDEPTLEGRGPLRDAPPTTQS